MVTLDWTWRATHGLPDTVLVVVTRTCYDDKSWNIFKDMLVPGYYRLLGDPDIVGIAVRTNERERVSWSLMAMTSYDALERLVARQVEWLSELATQLDIGNQLRHNAYRVMNTRDLPPSWGWVESTIRNVVKASPRGADAFPELTRILGIDGDFRA